jgi:hypothetical protein
MGLRCLFSCSPFDAFRKACDSQMSNKTEYCGPKAMFVSRTLENPIEVDLQLDRLVLIYFNFATGVFLTVGYPIQK